MSDYFTYYLNKPKYLKHRKEQNEGGTHLNLVSNKFKQRGVKQGDFLYVLTVLDGSLILFGRSKIKSITSWESDNFEKVALEESRYPDQWRFENHVPLSITERLECVDRHGSVMKLVFKKPGELDEQTLGHGHRQLTSASAALLDQQLVEYESLLRQAAKDIDTFEAEAETHGLEGARSQRLVHPYERDSRLRAAAVQLHGLRCCVCQFSFEDVYGEQGAGYIEVHHTKPLASYKGEEIEVNPKTDMASLCANCHRMIHRRRDKPLTMDELREMYVSRNT